MQGDETELSVPQDPGGFAERFHAVVQEVGRVLIGQEEVVRTVLVALIAGGHVLLEGPPGIGKTLLARTLSHVIGARWQRIQFTPDLMPSDVTGGNIYNRQLNRFDFHPGPVFTQLLLADEINRAPAKTQAALLEAMSDAQVSVDSQTRRLPQPFFVLATQNPIESEGTYPLPEAQLDRFLVKLLLHHPTAAVEAELLGRYLQGFDPARLAEAGLRQQLRAEQVIELRRMARTVRVEPELVEYIAAVVGRTRGHPAVELGASPRASIALLLCAQVIALSEGRDYALPDDIKRLAPAVLRHRFLLQPEAELEGVRADAVVAEVLAQVPVPGGEASE